MEIASLEKIIKLLQEELNTKRTLSNKESEVMYEDDVVLTQQTKADNNWKEVKPKQLKRRPEDKLELTNLKEQTADLCDRAIDDNWTRIPSKRRSCDFKSIKSSNNSSSQSIISKNKYSILSSSTDNLHLAESSLPNLSDGSLGPFVGHDVRRNPRKPKNNVTTRRQRKRLHQQKAVQLEDKCDQMCDQSVHNIPTIVNGQLTCY
jgi:hypothetical protein